MILLATKTLVLLEAMPDLIQYNMHAACYWNR